MKLKPFLKWAGGKTQLLQDLAPRVPENYNKYIEPFIGGGALFFAIKPSRAIINDINPDLIFCYKALQDYYQELIEELNSFIMAGLTEKNYYAIRNLDRFSNIHLSIPQRAARFIYLNKTGFNGLSRYNKLNQFNVPYGQYKKPTIYSQELLENISNYFNSIDLKLVNTNFSFLINDIQENDFIYFDPPYDFMETKTFTNYYGNYFLKPQQLTLSKMCDSITRLGAKFLLSNADTDYIRKIYKGYKIETVEARRSINSQGQGRGPVKELIISNY